MRTDELPSVEQIDRATIPLAGAHHTAIGIGYYALSRKEPNSLDFFRRSLMDSMHQTAAALGYRLEPINGPRLAVDNSEPNVMRERVND
jgi:hypothetical protein